jgi:hypothetical protein
MPPSIRPEPPRPSEVPTWARAVRIGAYVAAVLLFFAGQWQLISEQVGNGLTLILGSLTAVGLAQVRAERLLPKLLGWVAAVSAWAARLPSAKTTDQAPAPSSVRRIDAAVLAPASGPAPAGLHPLNWLLARIPEDPRELKVHKRSLLFLGIALLLASQPFLFLEKFLLAFVLLAPNLAANPSLPGAARRVLARRGSGHPGRVPDPRRRPDPGPLRA